MIESFLGSSYVDVTVVLRIMAFGVLPYSIYVCLKNIIDATSDKPVNSRNMLIAFVTFSGISTSAFWGFRGQLYIPIFVVICLYLLGGLTILEIRKIFAASEA